MHFVTIFVHSNNNNNHKKYGHIAIDSHQDLPSFMTV